MFGRRSFSQARFGQYTFLEHRLRFGVSNVIPESAEELQGRPGLLLRIPLNAQLLDEGINLLVWPKTFEHRPIVDDTRAYGVCQSLHRERSHHHRSQALVETTALSRFRFGDLELRRMQEHVVREKGALLGLTEKLAIVHAD